MLFYVENQPIGESQMPEAAHHGLSSFVSPLIHCVLELAQDCRTASNIAQLG
jgi:hypothetical protein